jgi:Cu-processing system ATP-binding protein
VITLADVSKRFGAVQVLQHVTLTVAPGRVTALVGPNGCGKSTLIRCILGLVHPDSGAITLPGGQQARDPAARAVLGYMPQAPRFPDHATGREVLALIDALRPDTIPDETVVQQLELGDHLDKPTRTLSGGSRQKLSAAIAFRYAPEVLILDEPTAGLDPLATASFKAAVHAARTRGAAILLTTHVVAELAALADDIVFLLDGRVQYAGSVEAMLRETGTTSLDAALAARMRGTGTLLIRSRDVA